MDLSAKIASWLETRVDLKGPQEFLSHKMVPVHSQTKWYYFGGLTLFLFGIQVMSGILLMLYYRPTVAESFESVRFIMTRVQFGWLIRSVHSWSANLMIFFAFVHMFSVAFMHAYRKPRELTWLSGVMLLGLLLGFGFSGYLLPWNTISYFATKVGTDVAGNSPIVGPVIARFLRGGEDIGAPTLTRFFALHVMILPLMAGGLIAFHLGLVQQHGMSIPPKFNPKTTPEMHFFPNFLLREVAVWYGALALLGALAAIYPWELGEKADPFASAPKGIRPEWYFLSQFYVLKLLPSHVWIIEGELFGMLFFGVLALIWVAIPFWGTRKDGTAKTRAVTGFGIFLISFLTIFTILGYVK